MNALPSNTAFEINPRDLYPRGDIAAIRKSLREPRREARVSVDAIPAPIKPKCIKLPPAAPLWQRQEITFNAHEEFYGEWCVNPARAYVIAHAKRLGTTYQELIRKRGKRQIVAIRHLLMFEVWQTFSLSLPQIGKLFGGRDNSTVTHALRKHGVKSVQTLPLSDRGDEIYSMWLSGLKQQVIAKRLGVTQSSVCRFMRKQPWWPKPEKRTYVREQGETVAKMLSQGATLRDISRSIGFKPDAIAMYARSVGLLPPAKVKYMEDSADIIHQMHLAGNGYAEIGAATGFHARSIGKFIRRMGWKR